MKTDTVARSFAAFLADGWQEMSRLLLSEGPAEELAADWMQANWETLVEAALFPGGSGFLEVYGDGADCNGASSRVFQPQAQATHRIRCLPRQGDLSVDLATGRKVDPLGMMFWGFISWDEGTYKVEPPWNAVLLEGVQDAVVGLEEIVFSLEQIQRSA